MPDDGSRKQDCRTRQIRLDLPAAEMKSVPLVTPAAATKSAEAEYAYAPFSMRVHGPTAFGTSICWVEQTRQSGRELFGRSPLTSVYFITLLITLQSVPRVSGS